MSRLFPDEYARKPWMAAPEPLLFESVEEWDGQAACGMAFDFGRTQTQLAKGRALARKMLTAFIAYRPDTFGVTGAPE